MRGLVNKVAGPLVARAVREISLDEWPRWAADLLEVKTPSNVPTKIEESPEGGSNINIILHFLDETRGLDGDVAECGVFKGASLAAMALHIRHRGDPRHVHGFDSFQGFDESAAKDVEWGGAPNSERRVGGFAGTSLRIVRNKLGRLGVSGRTTLHPGYFAQTLVMAPERQYSFVHLDCDIHDSYQQTLQYFYPRLVEGGVILIDEYDDPPWPGCNLAVDFFLADKPEALQRICSDKYVKYYIQKS